MHPIAISLLLVGGCGGGPQVAVELKLDGPDRVRVEQLGPVDGPRAVTGDGAQPDGVVWTVQGDGVAQVVDGRVVARAPGEAQVIGSWSGQQVAWTLVVDPAMVLAFRRVPGVLSVGSTQQLAVTATIGGAQSDPGPIDWESSDPGLLEIDAQGMAKGLAPGKVWVTAQSRSGSQAIVELDVVP